MITPHNQPTGTAQPNDRVAPFMNTLTQCVNKVVKDGYSESFKVSNGALKAASTEKCYRPEQVSVINFYRFEGQSDPADNTIMYVIQTTDGSKGTIIDAYGPYADGKVNAFMNEVEDIQKKQKTV